jgi:predicted  nucleic acid-binding Zn-ribbon protein
MTTTATINTDLLKRLRRILRQESDLKSRIRKGPLRLAVITGAADEIAARLEATRGELKKTRMSADQKQLQLNERETRIEDLKGKRNACASNREYQLLSDQIAADQQANSVQSDEILELLERIDRLQASIAADEQALQAARAESERVRAVVEGELKQLNSELAEVQGELAEAGQQLPGDVRNTIRRLIASIGEDAIAPVEDNSCGHCNTTLVTQQISELTLQQVVWCKSCGSLLYLP